MKLKIKAVSDKIGKDIPYPFYATAGAAAMDLCACVDAPVEVAPRALVSIPTGIAIALPSAEYVALVFARSGLCLHVEMDTPARAAAWGMAFRSAAPRGAATPTWPGRRTPVCWTRWRPSAPTADTRW